MLVQVLARLADCGRQGERERKSESESEKPADGRKSSGAAAAATSERRAFVYFLRAQRTGELRGALCAPHRTATRLPVAVAATSRRESSVCRKRNSWPTLPAAANHGHGHRRGRGRRRRSFVCLFVLVLARLSLSLASSLLVHSQRAFSAIFDSSNRPSAATARNCLPRQQNDTRTQLTQPAQSKRRSRVGEKAKHSTSCKQATHFIAHSSKHAATPKFTAPQALLPFNHRAQLSRHNNSHSNNGHSTQRAPSSARRNRGRGRRSAAAGASSVALRGRRARQG